MIITVVTKIKKIKYFYFLETLGRDDDSNCDEKRREKTAKWRNGVS
jgi:hypothetical protein